MTIHDNLVRPLVTEKGVTEKDDESDALLRGGGGRQQDQVKQAVEKLFNVKVEEVRTATFEGKLRRRGRFAGYRSDWKKAYVKLVAGQKVPEYAEM